MKLRMRRRAGAVAAHGLVVLVLVHGSGAAPAQEVPDAEADPAAEASYEETAATETPVEPPVEPPAEPSLAPGALSGDSPDYTIGAADVVRIQVWKNPELSTEVPVRPDGRISVPLLGDVTAAGMTTRELRDSIATGLTEYVTAPDVTVIVTQVNSKVVFLVGEVLRPSAIPLNRDMRVLDAIAVAGGFSPFADRNDVKILRPQPDGTVEEHEFDYPGFVKGKKPESNMILQPGDTIVVPD